MAIPLRVLIVDDSPDDAELLIHEIRKGGYCETARRVDAAGAMRTALEETGWDLIISDYSLPGFGGREALTIPGCRHGTSERQWGGRGSRSA